jgi:hypothetical protein
MQRWCDITKSLPTHIHTKITNYKGKRNFLTKVRDPKVHIYQRKRKKQPKLAEYFYEIT